MYILIKVSGQSTYVIYASDVLAENGCSGCYVNGVQCMLSSQSTVEIQVLDFTMWLSKLWSSNNQKICTSQNSYVFIILRRNKTNL